MTNFKEYTDKELDEKLDSLMNDEDDWMNECFAGLGDFPDTEESLKWKKEEEEAAREAAIEAARYQPCGKCNGKGRIDHYHYVSRGVCFACDGEGKIYK